MVLFNEAQLHICSNHIKSNTNTKQNSNYQFINKKQVQTINRTNLLLALNFLLLFSSLSFSNCQNNTDLAFNFSTKKIETQLSNLQNHSLYLLNESFSNLNDTKMKKAETDFITLKNAAQGICLDLKNKLVETNQNYTSIRSIFPDFISGIRSIFKNILNVTNPADSSNITLTSSVIYYDWLKEDNLYKNVDDENDVDEVYFYAIDNIYLIFPIFTIVLFAFLSASIFNCLYCKFCYCCAFRFTTVVRLKLFFHRITLFLIIFSVLFLVIMVILQQRFSKVNTYANYFTCELLNKQVLTFIANQNYAKDFDKEETDTKGLIQLRDGLISNYKTDFEKIRTIVDNNNLISSATPLEDAKTNVTSGIDNMKSYVNRNTFSFPDPNNNYFETEYGFNLTYKCRNCKALVDEIENTTQRVLNEHYKNWSDSIEAINMNLHDSIKHERGWNNIVSYHETLQLYLNSVIYFGQRYLGKLIDESKDITSIFNSYSNASLALLILALIFVNLGIFFYYSAFEQKVAQGRRLEQERGENDSNNLEIEKYTNNLLEKNRFLRSWDRRKFFHLIINFAMAIVVFANFMAYYLLLYSLYTYDVIEYIDNNFYEIYQFDKFKLHPYGDLIDACNKDKENPKNLFDYLGLNVPKSFWLKNVEMLINLNNSRINRTYKEFDDLNSKINAMKINEFTHADGESETNVIAWDIENEEQINFFLFEMANYTQMKFAVAHETLQYFTDYNLIKDDNNNFNITQKKNCSSSSTEDVYTSSEQHCGKYFNTYKYLKEITPVIDKNNNKTCFRIGMKVEDCIETDSDCFAKGILNRYKPGEIYSTCQVDEETLISKGANNTKILFQNKIVYYLKLARKALIFKNELEQKIAEYKTQFTSNIKSNLDAYITKLISTTDKYMELLPGFTNVIKYFENDYLSNNPAGGSKPLIFENYLSCSKFDLTNVFYLGKTLISSELYGIGLLFIIISIDLFILTSLNLYSYFNLLSEKEANEVKKDNLVIQAIEEKERLYFMSGSFIDKDDRIYMNLHIKEEENEKSKQQKKIDQEKKINPARKSVFVNEKGEESDEKANSPLEKNNHAKGKQDNKAEGNKVIKDFILKQMKNQQEKFNNKKKKNQNNNANNTNLELSRISK